MQVLGVTAQKGGVGKTTLAVHLAVLAHQQGKKVLVLDLDSQGSCAEWFESRESDEPSCATSTADEVQQLLPQVKEAGFDLVIIDTAPNHSADIATVARVADFCIVPTAPAIFDLRAIRKTVDLFDKLKASDKFGVVLNQCPVGRGGDARRVTEAKDFIKDSGWHLCPTAVIRRQGMADALIGGIAITEFEPKGKASFELKDLYKWINEQLEARA